MSNSNPLPDQEAMDKKVPWGHGYNPNKVDLPLARRDMSMSPPPMRKLSEPEAPSAPERPSDIQAGIERNRALYANYDGPIPTDPNASFFWCCPLGEWEEKK
jgi:hypothetical protein